MRKFIPVAGFIAGLLILQALVPTGFAGADEPRLSPLPKTGAVPVQAYGEQNPECREWTDSCHICRRGETGEISCSTPGIACQQGGVVCKVKK
jgi:hypothetical protein